MRITEKLVNSPEEEGVTLEYIKLTKDFEEIKEYAYTVDCVYEIKGRLYQVEEKVNKRNIYRASKTMLVNVEHIISVRNALNGRLYARMENGEEILITRRYSITQ